MNVLLMPQPDRATESNRGLVAAEVRGWLGKRSIRVSNLPALLGNSREFWRRRVVVGDVPLDIDNLTQLADLLGCTIADFVLTTKGPDRGGSGPSLPDMDSNHEPTHFESALHMASVVELASIRARKMDTQYATNFDHDAIVTKFVGAVVGQ